MSTFDFSSRDACVFERTVECQLDVLTKTSSDELIVRYKLVECVDWVKTNGFSRVCLQFPDSLLQDSTAIALFMKNAVGNECYVLGDTSYGSCCVDEVAAEHINGDAIIHFGHACLSPTTRLLVYYVFMDEQLDITTFRTNLLSIISNRNIVIFYDVQFLHICDTLQDVFKDLPDIIIAKKCINKGVIHDSSSKEEPNILNWTFQLLPNTKYTAVYIGQDGLPFQNLYLALPEQQWFRFDKNTLHECHERNNRFLMQRLHLVEKVKDANVIGILVGTLGVEDYMTAVNRIRTLAKKKGKRCYILAVGKPNVAKLANFPEIEIFVMIACPENMLTKECKEYYRPIVGVFEVMLALGGRPWTPKYTSDFSQILDVDPELGATDDLEVSLVTGKIRNLVNDEATLGLITPMTSELVERGPLTLAEYSGANFLANRTWRGLDPALGKTAVNKAEKGRSGVASGYHNETDTLFPNTSAHVNDTS